MCKALEYQRRTKDILRGHVRIENKRHRFELQGGPERAFVREELMEVPETTEKPPDWV